MCKHGAQSGKLFKTRGQLIICAGQESRLRRVDRKTQQEISRSDYTMGFCNVDVCLSSKYPRVGLVGVYWAPVNLGQLPPLRCFSAEIMASHLGSGRVNLTILRESYRRELLECLDKCTGNKVVLPPLHCHLISRTTTRFSFWGDCVKSKP